MESLQETGTTKPSQHAGFSASPVNDSDRSQMQETLTARTFDGLKWSYAGTAVNSLLQIAFTAVMARLLAPSLFGLIALAGVILRFMSYFAQMGMGTAIIQRKEIDEEDIRAAFTSSALLSAFFFGLLWVSAPVIVELFDTPDLIPIVRILGLSFVFGGLSTTSVALLRRNMMFRSIAIIEMLGFVAGYGCVGIVLAIGGYGVWSLVFAALGQRFLTTLLAYIATRHSIVPLFSSSRYAYLYRFGGRISVIGFLEFVGSNLDTMWIGRALGTMSLGIYNRAFMVVNLPMQYVSSSFSRVLLPSFSRVQTDKPRLKKAYLSTVMIAGGILIPACIGISAAAKEIVLLVLGSGWTESIPILRVLAIATALNLMSHFGGIVCEATATLNLKMIVQIAYIALIGILFYSLRDWDGIGFAYGLLIGGAFLFVSYLAITIRLFLINQTDIIRSYGPGAFSGALIAAVLLFATTLMNTAGLSTATIFCAQVIIGVGLIVGLLFTPVQAPLRQELGNRLNASGMRLDENTITGKILVRCRNVLLST